MKTYDSNHIKNIVLLGNGGSGKSTLAEAMLYEGKVIDRKGDISAKNTVSDYNPIELENENSVFSSVMYTESNNTKINIIDAPGADDFVGGAISGLAVTEMAAIVINSQHGPEVGTEIHARHCAKSGKPMVFVVNKADQESSNFDKATELIKERFGGNAIIVQYPINQGPKYDSFIDIIAKKMYKYPIGGGTPEISDIPESEAAKADDLRAELIEKAAEGDEALMEIYFDKGVLTEEEVTRGLKAGIINRGAFPIFCVSAKNQIGIGRFMEFITASAPSPVELPLLQDKEGNTIDVNPSGEPAIFIFKTAIEQHVGEINYFKVASGKVTEGIDLTNSKSGNKERVSQLLVAAGKNRTKVSEFVAGDIGATVKLKGTKTNQTLSNGLIVSPIVFPEPKFRTAVRTLNDGDEEKLGEALNRMHDEDPTILIEYSKELKQIIISGQGEYHLNILRWHLDNIYKVETEFIAPKIPYRETITKVAQADYRHKKQSGGSGQFGEVHMIIEPYVEGAADATSFKVMGKELKVSVRGTEEHPLPWGGKLIFNNCIVGGSIDARFLPAILKGIMEKMEEGPLTGSYARDIKVYIYDGKMHPVDSNEISFKLAGRNAFRAAFKEAGPKIMEPVYNVEVLVPADRMGDVMSDLQTRRAIVQGMSSEDGFEKISAKVPLAEMNKYSTTLSSLTNGRAMYTMSFDEYEAVPADVQSELLKAYEAELVEE